MKLVHNEDIAKHRADNYPPVEDQLDAIWKWLSKTGQDSAPDLHEMAARIAAVKAKYPKS